MKGLMKACSGGSAMWIGWRGIGLGECASSRSVSRPRKRWTDKETRVEYQANEEKVQSTSEWRRFARGNAWGIARGMNP